MRSPKFHPVRWLAIVLCVLTWGARWSCSQEQANPRALLIQGIDNRQPAFLVRVAVDKPERVYREGEQVTIFVKSERPGYLYLINLAPGEDLPRVLVPNRFLDGNRIEAQQLVQVPHAQASFTIDVGPPFGEEVIKAVVSQTPLQHPALQQAAKNFLEPMPADQVKGLSLKLKQQPPATWAEHHVTIRTLGKNERYAPAPRRVALNVGLSRFKDPAIRPLKVSDKDAAEMGRSLKEACGFDQTWVLQNEQATLANIERAIRKDIAESTRPGDLVVIYWSGHGGRCADNNGDEKDGFDEFLVPYDGNTANVESLRSSMLVDDAFGRWLQALDGRKVVVILDTCHSGGQAQHEKGLGGSEENGQALDFLDGELARTKDIGQKDAVMLASSRANQLSYERRDGTLSVMTYFLVQWLDKKPLGASLQDAYQMLSSEVPAYVQKEFPGTTQNPVLAPEQPAGILLRP